MSRIFNDAHLHEQADAKSRRKLQDQRRMAYRRAIEDYVEQCRLQQELADYPEQFVVSAAQNPAPARRRAA
jgi:hypothetical protein